MKKEKDIITIYEPNKLLKIGFFRIWGVMFSDFLTSYHLGWRLFVRDFSAKYKQQILGVLWVFIIPIMAVLSFTLMAKAKVLNVEGINAPYPIYSFLSVAIWGLLQAMIVNVTGVINKTGGMIAKINFPKESLLVSPVYIAMIDFILKIILFIFVCLFYRFYVHPLNILYIFTLIPTILFGIGLGLFLTVFGAVIKDVSSFLSYFFQFLMIVTPIMYKKPADSILGKIATYNPLYYLVVVPRDLMLFGQSDDIKPFIYCVIISVVLFFAGWRFYKISISKIIEKV